MQINRFAILAFLMPLVSLFSCSSPKGQEQGSGPDHFLFFEGNTMGTTYHIKIYDSVEVSQASVDSVLRLIDTALSTYNPESYISCFNAACDDLASFDIEFKRMFEGMMVMSSEIHTQSYGAFDPSAAELFNYWGFGEDGPQQKTDDSTLQAILANKGMGTYFSSIKGSEMVLPKQIQVNFNAIAKGYGVDEVSSLLSVEGCKNFMVEIGGEVFCAGVKPDSSEISIGINTPQENADQNSYVSVVQLKNEALATSGNYRNFYVKDGKKYSHTIDPRTGYPSENNMLSASVKAKDCATADAWATACMVLGVDSSIHVINQIDDVDVYILFDEGGEVKDTMSASF